MLRSLVRLDHGTAENSSFWNVVKCGIYRNRKSMKTRWNRKLKMHVEQGRVRRHAWWWRRGDGIQSKCEWMTHDFIWVQIHIRNISARGKWIVNMYLNFNKFVLKLGLVYGGRKVLFWGVLMELSVELSNYIMKLAGERGRPRPVRCRRPFDKHA